MIDVKLVVFDMAGTVVKDEREVEKCFFDAAQQVGLSPSREEINAMMGWSKVEVFEKLWKDQLGDGHPELDSKVEESYQLFRNILENHYLNAEVLPTEGALELLQWLKRKGIEIAFSTGFYRVVTNIILKKLGWDKGLNEQYLGNEDALIDFSICSDEVPAGRPEPFMIQKAMSVLGIENPKHVLKIGDTPSDLQAGKRAGCGFTLGVTNGSHTREELMVYENDGLLDNIGLLKEYIVSQEPRLA